MINFFRNFKRLTRDVNSLDMINDLNRWIARFAPEHCGNEPLCSLDLGCGQNPRNPFRADLLFGVDLRENKASNVLAADLATSPIPFEDLSFHCVTAYDFIEHIPRLIYSPNSRFPFVELMNEVCRVLKEGGIFFSYTPVFPFDEAFRDPTHVNFITARTFPNYFGYDEPIARMYGFTGKFDRVQQALLGSHLLTVMYKCKSSV
jgi:SAM-dependent methyltransferase